MMRGFGSLSSVLCLGAHADDIEIGAGATVLRILEESPQARFTWVVFSAEGVRAREARQAARLFLGGSNRHHVRVLSFPDRRFPEVWGSIKHEFERLAAMTDPDLILTHRTGDAHQDHRLLAEFTWNTFRRHWVAEYEIPKYDGDLVSPNLYVPVSREQLRRKIEFLHQAFRSQARKPWFTTEVFRGIASIRGVECRAPEGFAEGFHARKLVVAVPPTAPDAPPLSRRRQDRYPKKARTT